MATTLSTYLANIRTTIAALTPTTAGASFVDSDGLLGIDGEAPIADRLFSVAVVDGGLLDGYMNASLAAYMHTVEVAVRYDRGADRDAGLARVLEDELKIKNAMIDGANWTANVQHVAYSGTRREPAEQQFEILRLTFEATCLESL